MRTTPPNEPHRHVRRHGLTSRQFECLQGVADHLSSDQIAFRLGISTHTVDGHLAAVMSKLRASSRRDAVLRYQALCDDHDEKLTGQFVRIPAASENQQHHPSPAQVMEERTPFYPAQPEPPRSSGRSGHDLVAVVKGLLLVTGLAIGIIVLIISLGPLVDSAANLANHIAPYRDRSAPSD